MTYPSPLKVGVLLLSSATQFLDVAPIDMLGMLERHWLEASPMPEALVAKALDIEYYFISETGESTHQMTGGFKVSVTHFIATCPPLNILLIGGPHPSYRPSPAMTAFIKSQYEHVNALMVICTGYTATLFSGILDGKEATAPKELLPMLRSEAPAVKWVEKRWTRDGKLWTSGAVANGMELMAAFMRSEFGEQRELVETVLGMSDMPVRGQEY
ncbi:MAG: hypothetical protein Q9220_005082 [cf. Caloplaca sp. 1 TL-2023]